MIAIEKVTKAYGDARVVDTLSLHVREGEMFVLLGGSGSGKTTTLKMINRLIEPTSGSIRVAGRDVSAEAPHELRRRIGYAFQRIGLFPHLTVAENIGVTPTLLGWETARIAKRVDDLLELLELPPDKMRHRFPSELSGGQAQRVGVARALAAEPRVILFDEPFGALDPLTRDRLQIALAKIVRDFSLTCVFVTHDLAEACFLADRIAIMRHGKLVQVGTAKEIAQSPADAEVADLFSTPQKQWEQTAARLGLSSGMRS